MTQVWHHAVALMSTIQRSPQRLPPEERQAPKALPSVIHATGRTRAKHGLCCHASEGQHAHVQQQGPDIGSLAPSLQQQWDHAANAHLGNIAIKLYSAKKVHWTCDHCPDGNRHSWSAVVYSRTRGTGCPQCIGRQVCKHNSLATKAPLVAAEWDYQANDHTPDNVVAQSNDMPYWHCKVCSCKWEATPNSRVSRNKTGCPECASDARTKKTKQPTFAECNHRLLAEWDRKRNAAQGHFLLKIRLKSNKQIFWLCTKCPAGQEHSWSARPSDRTARTKSGCPFCAGKAACVCNTLQALYPDTAAEWDYSKNHQGQASDYTASCECLAWWSSPQRGSWQQTIKSHTSGPRQAAARPRRIKQREDSTGPS
ncbi:hypothetical protein ABBQ38_012261 [Trebouxia sp. C0009 RCD-2024]